VDASAEHRGVNAFDNAGIGGSAGRSRDAIAFMGVRGNQLVQAPKCRQPRVIAALPIVDRLSFITYPS
jgi:hypothetical protein